MKTALKQLQKAIAYQKKQQEQIIEAQIGLLNARIESLLQEGQCKPVMTALDQIKPLLTRETKLTDLKVLGDMLEGL